MERRYFACNMRPILLIIVLAQFFCTSLWFAGNAVVSDISAALGLDPRYLGHLTSAVQLGFIAGTLIFAFLGITDRFRPSQLFFFCSMLAAACNAAITLPGMGAVSILSFRFFTGFFLAGIYPVGMKIAADYFREGLGKSLGFLVGALVLGTGLPHLLKSLSLQLNWHFVLYGTSVLAIIGGLAVWRLVPEGPYRSAGTRPQQSAFRVIFSHAGFRAASLGYFGHMWELYTFWAFVPVMLQAFIVTADAYPFNISLWSFFCIAIGAPACILGGYLSQKWGAQKVATWALGASCVCCLLWPFVFLQNSLVVFLIYLLIWGAMVVADSPLFSTLVAQQAPASLRGTALTLVVCVGFGITIISIQTLNWLSGTIPAQYLYMLLAAGPMLSLFPLFKKAAYQDHKAPQPES